MDGEEDDFMSGNHSDDGGGTPVQDEHAPCSDGEEMRSERHHSEDEGDGAGHVMGRNGTASGSDNEGNKDADSISEGEAAAHNSDSEAEPPQPVDSDEESPLKRRATTSDNEGSPVKRLGSPSDNKGSPGHRPGTPSDNEESPIKERDITFDNEGSPVKRQGSTSDMEESGPKVPGSDSEHEDHPQPQARQSNAGSDSDTEVPKHKKPIESDDEETEKPEEGKGKWKAVMHSDSEDEEEGPMKAAGSDQEGESRLQPTANDSEDNEDKPVKRKKAILSDSEDEEEKADKPAAKKNRAVSDDDNSDSDAGSDAPDKSMAAKLRELGSDSEDEEDKDGAEKKDEKTLFGSDSDSGDEEEKMIADIFGESGDEEGEEFTGFNQEDLEGEKNKAQASAKKAVEDDSDSDDGVDRGGKDTSFMSDFDVMLARKKAQSGKRRRNRDGGTFISDADDVVSAMITKMNEAAEEDRTLNSQKKPALKKLTLLPTVVMHLKKQDLKETFIDSGVMSAIKEWISPLPDKSLPALKIREELLRILQELPSVSQETLKHSGIGRSVMFLYKHPKESRPNKDVALKLINEWSRPIFGLTSNYKGMTREERQQRDLDQQMPQRRRLSSGGQTPRRDLEKVLTGEEKALRPGDPGFCARARVPMPSNKDYVVRPKWNVEVESSRSGFKKGLSRLEKHKRRIAEERKRRRLQGAVKISVEGNHMPL
ncbi:protein IWS1 homolog isoform X2 [Hypomesus transpacificus]|uniref:protein IWS1 homolog isoform X2 n=1 Tax=Hypomesus transpacificus TaxID=137520 RepID=UPI001F07B519|nr:protein IWS1 homolog isoform X2 [Hypomesus transpacificus]